MTYPIAIYDTGVGGLSVLEELLRQVGNADVLYFEDSKIFPMGPKNFIDIQERLKKVCRYLFNKQGVNLILLACNTATVTSIRELQLRWLPTEYPNQGKNIIGISTPITEQMVAKYWDLRDQPGIILSTMATFRTGFYQSEFLRNGFRNFTAVPSSNLAAAIQNMNTIEIKEAIEEAFVPFEALVKKASLVVLACSHYHWSEKLIRAKFNQETVILNPREVVANKLIDYIKRHPEYKISYDSSLQILTTGSSSKMKIKLKYFLNRDSKIQLVDNTDMAI